MSLGESQAANHWLCHEVPVARWPLHKGAEIMLWLFDLDGAWPLDIEGPLSITERQCADRFRFAAHRLRYLRGRWAMRQILGSLCGQSASQLRLVTGTHGKPWLQDHPQLRFNLTHSDRWALMATSPKCDVGVDMEHLRTLEDADGVAQSTMSPAEWAAYLAEAPLTRPSKLLRTWARKEACLKALGTGLSLDARDMDLMPGIQTEPPWVLCQLGGNRTLLHWQDVRLPSTCPAVAACAWAPPSD